MTKFDLNGRTVSVRSPDDTPLLWVIRDELQILAATMCHCQDCLHFSPIVRPRASN